MSALLYTNKLCRNFGGVSAIDAVNIEFKNKGLRSIIGPNGAGKSTLINIITGKLPTNSGQVVFKEKKITNKPIHELVQMGISRTFQITSIFLNLSVYENVRIAVQAHLGGSLKILSTKTNLTNVTRSTLEILDKLELSDKAHLEAKTLAYGDQRVLEVAIALAGSPKILFLDEPTAGMSPTETKHISDLIQALAKEISVVVVEHDMDMIMKISDTITVLHYGSIIAEGVPKEIQKNDLVREAYLGSKH